MQSIKAGDVVKAYGTEHIIISATDGFVLIRKKEGDNTVYAFPLSEVESWEVVSRKENRPHHVTLVKMIEQQNCLDCGQFMGGNYATISCPGPKKEVWRPKMNEWYFASDPASERLYCDSTWVGDKCDHQRLTHGLVFRTAEEAVARAEEILSKIKE